MITGQRYWKSTPKYKPLSEANLMTLKLLRIPSSKSCKMRSRAEILPFSRKNLPFKTSVADPHHFNAHSAPDPPSYFNADPNFAPHQSDVYLRPLVYKPSRAPLWAFRPPLRVRTVPPRLHFKPLKLPNFDPYPNFHSNSHSFPK